MAGASVYEIQGQQVTLPVEVRDASSGNAMYQVDAATAQALLPGSAFKVLEATPGQTQFLLGVIDYRDNDLGDYNEVAIIFFVYPANATPAQAGTFIYKLPVNQSFTCEAGCTIWGFPKSVDTIDYSYDDDKATCRLEMDGQHVFTLSLPRGRAQEGAEAAADTAGPTYTYINGVPHQTLFTTGGDTIVSPGNAGIDLSLGSHPIADQLRTLGLPKPALMSTWNEHMKGCFDVPEKLP
jgi:hypothetical protein